MYQAPVVNPPCVEDMERLAADLNLGIGNKQIAEYHDVITENLKKYNIMERYVEPTLPVKYPRTPGYRPSMEENKYNAWYYKTDIKGAPEGILSGYKVVIKDHIQVAGVPMMHGSRVIEGYVPDYDPTVVSRVLDKGANIVGKGVCEDFCFGGSSFNSHPFPVLNPHDPSRSAGGSSSGCAVLVYTGECDMAVGGDQAGSIRMPCSWSGVVGLKPSYGLVPYTGIMSMTPCLDYCGPIARTVKDCALLLEAIAGDDGGLDMRQRRIPDQADLPQYSKLLTGEVSGRRIGIVTEGYEGCDKDVIDVVDAAARRLTEKGAIVEHVSIPMHSDAADYKAIVLPCLLEAACHIMIGNQGFAYGPPGYIPTSAVDNYFAGTKARSRDFPPTVKLTLMQGKYITENYGIHFYAKSQNILRLLAQVYDKALDRYDVLVMPTMKFTAMKLPKDEPMTLKEYLNNGISMISNTAPFNGTGHPAITINAGFSGGLPVGMQIIGRHLADDVVLNIAYAYEQILTEK